MPSMTTNRAECSLTATETRSWLSERLPSRLTSAYSMRKAGIRGLINCRALYRTARQAEEIRASHDRKHDGIRTARVRRQLGNPDLRASQRESPLPGTRVSPARRAAAAGRRPPPAAREELQARQDRLHHAPAQYPGSGART